MSEPTIKFEPNRIKGVIHYNVLIDGEHRATFEGSDNRVGYTLKACGDRDTIAYGMGGTYRITKADFADVVRKHLNKIPTLVQIEQIRMIDQAHRENRERDDQIARHRREVRREVLREALKRYIDFADTNPDFSPEHVAMAEKLYGEYSKPDAWV